MSGWMAQALPSLGALGVWTYWIIGAAALLEAFFVTGVLAPGTLIVDAGGALARLGQLNPFELVWFVAVGAALGGEAGFWTARRLGRRMTGRWDPARLPAYGRAERLFQRRGGLALVMGRFLGPVSGLAPLAAGLAGMEPRRFHLWNAVGAVPYAAFHVGVGYAAGDVLARVGPQMERAAILAAAVAAALGLIWLVSSQLRRGLPLAIAALGTARDAGLAKPAVARAIARHPRAAGFVARRFATDRFEGLTLTALLAVLVYVAAAWADSALDFLFEAQVAETDLRLARLIHAFWTPEALQAFGLITQLGHWPVVTAALVGATVALLVAGRRASLVQLWVALAGELITVRLLKGAFDRPRPDLGFFVETSGSFPSGHATISVAFWGTLAAIAWRERVIGPTTALVAAATFAFLIGGSRIYLIVHFLSDVANGWLVGALWLVIGFAVAERMRAAAPPRPKPGTMRRSAAALIVALSLGAAGWLAVIAEPPLAVREASAAPEILVPAAVAGTPALPLRTEALDGEALAPVAVMAAAADLDAVLLRLEAAGWRAADAPTAATLARAAWHDWTEDPYPAAPLFPAFWRGHPHDAALRGADGDPSLRLWDSGARAADAGGAGARLILIAPASGDDDIPAGAAAALRARLSAAIAPGAGPCAGGEEIRPADADPVCFVPLR